MIDGHVHFDPIEGKSVGKLLIVDALFKFLNYESQKQRVSSHENRPIEQNVMKFEILLGNEIQNGSRALNS